MRHSYLLLVTIESDETARSEPPLAEEIANGITEGLPKEWFDVAYEGYAIIGIDKMGEITR